MGSAFTKDQLFDSLEKLEKGVPYPYASLSKNGTDRFFKINKLNRSDGSIKLIRTGRDNRENVVSIPGTAVEILLNALSSRKAVEINGLYRAGPNWRSMLEAVLANTEHVFVCEIENTKHIFWNPEDSHRLGQISISSTAPQVYYPDQGVTSQEIKYIVCKAIDFLEATLEYFKTNRSKQEWRDECEACCVISSFQRKNVLALGDINKLPRDSICDFLENSTLLRRCKPIHVVHDLAVRPNTRLFLSRSQNEHVQSFAFLKNDSDRPKEFDSAFVSELLMAFHPGDYALYDECAHEALVTLGLMDADVAFSRDFDSLAYTRYMGIAAAIRQKMIAKGIEIRPDEGSGEADYLTVYEFLYFVTKRRDEIFKFWSEHMKTEVKLEESVKIESLEGFIKAFSQATESAGLSYDTKLLTRFVCALLTKPFVVLTGLSGSGKTKLAQAFVQWIAKDEMYRVVPVGADWSNSEKLLGYHNALDPNEYVMPDSGILKLLIAANDNPSVPFFLILDEMNLSHVERYFADFLSAMESGGKITLYDGGYRKASDGTVVPPTIDFPRNLFVIGTMNVDETTHMFSPKVLDRAQVIEFRVNEKQMDDFLSDPKPVSMNELKGKALCYASDFLENKNTAPSSAETKKDVKDALLSFFPNLAKLGAEFAFRTAGEVSRFCAYGMAAGLDTNDAVDAAIMQKLLPKLHGSRRRLALALEEFWKICRRDDSDLALNEACRDDATIAYADVARYPVSAEKICRMYRAAELNGYASYAEA